MNSTRSAILCAALSLISFCQISSVADTYTDASGETINSAAGTIDFIGAEVTHDATDVTFKLTVSGNISTTDWGKFMIGIANGKGGASGGTKTGNGWGRPINLDAGANGGVTHWIGSWVDWGGGANFWEYTGPTTVGGGGTGGAWTSRSGAVTFTSTAGATSLLQFKVSRSALGINSGDTIFFDAYSSGGGGGDGAIDALAKPTQSVANWGDTHTSAAPNLYSYTLTAPADFDEDTIPDATDTDDDNDGLLDTVETGTGIWVSSSDTGTLPKNADTDADGLKDGVETNTGTYVNVTDTGSNPHVADDLDLDMLPDFYDSDDDGDGLADTVESNTTIWISSTDTGTNPRNADTDGDGLRDGAETNTGSYASAADTGTNPHIADQALVILAGNNVLFPAGEWASGNTNNRLVPVVGGPYSIKSITRFIGSATNNIQFKFTGGNWDTNWGIGSNATTVLNPSNGIISGTLFRDKTPTTNDRTANINIRRALGEYVFIFNDATNSLEFSVARKTYSTFQDYIAAYSLTGPDTNSSADPDSDLMDNQAEYAANTAPTSADTDGDGLFDYEEVNANYTEIVPPVSSLLAAKVLNPVLPDTDGDGLLDFWEINNGLDPTDDGTAAVSYINATGLTVAANPNGANGDPDGDGSSNLQEQANGTSPVVSNSGLFSPYTKITIPGSFTGWNVNGNLENTMKLEGNNVWRAMIFVSTNAAAATNEFKFAPGSWTGSWGRGPSANVAVKDASENLLTSVLNTNGHYQFDFNDLTGAYTITRVNGGADTNSNNLPDAYEQWYGALLNPAVTVLDPGGDPDGDGKTTAQEFESGGNPVLDLAAPVITLVGDETLVLALNGTYADPGVAVTDDSTNAVVVTTNSSQVIPATNGVYPVTYVATDGAGNSTTNNQRYVVVGDWTNAYPSPIFYNLQSLVVGGSSGRIMTNNQAGSLDVYAQFYRRGSTEGTNRTDPKVLCWIGLTTNTNAMTGAESDWVWTAASVNSGNTSGNDEYKATYTNLAPGTYQVISRWQFDGGVFGYGGINEDNQGGALGLTVSKTVGAGTNAVTTQIPYLPASLTVTAVSVGFAKIQFPTAPAPITAGDAFDVYFQFYSAGVTEAVGAPTWAGVRAQLGYSVAGGDPSVVGAYTWVNASWNAQMTGGDANNDEYKGTLTGLAAGTYVYAVRFSVDGGGTWVYGGTGGIWNNDSGSITVNAAPSAGSTFAGWAGSGTATNSELVGKYGIGGATNSSAASEQPLAALDSNTLALSAIVRTNDPKLEVVGEAAGSLTNWNTNGVTMTASPDTNGVPEGHQRRVFSVDRTNNPSRQFLRLKATLQP